MKPSPDADDAVADRDVGQAGAVREAALPMLVTLLPIVTLVRLVQIERLVPDAGDAVGDRDAGQAGAKENARFPMLVTLLPIVTLLRLLHSQERSSRCW